MSDGSSSDASNGEEIVSGADEYHLKRRAAELDRFTDENGDAEEVDPDSLAAHDPFVETDEIASIRDRVEGWLDVPRPVHLIGPTGSGKTALALHIATQRDRPVVWINGDATMETTDLVGEHAGKEQYLERDNFVSNVVKKKSIIRDRWVDNPLSIAVDIGATLVYNEFSRTKPAANNVLLSVFEEGTLERPGQRGDDRILDVHPEFRAILTSNSAEYAGVHEPQDALLDRLIGIHLGFYDRETEIAIVTARVDDVDEERAEEIVDLVRELRDDLDVTVGTRAAVMVAQGLSAFGDEGDETLVDVCTDVLSSKVSSREEVEDLRSAIESTV